MSQLRRPFRVTRPPAPTMDRAVIHTVSQAPVFVRAGVWKVWITSFCHAARLTTAVDKGLTRSGCLDTDEPGFLTCLICPDQRFLVRRRASPPVAGPPRRGGDGHSRRVAAPQRRERALSTPEAK